LQKQLHAEMAADKAQVAKLAAALKEAEQAVSWSARWGVH
jgi:hypothetical protein